MIKDNKFMIMALLVSASTAVLAENVVEVNQSTTNYQEVNTEATSSDSTRLYLPTAGGVVWSISDPIILEKKLDVVSETGVLGLDKDDITFKVHSNYTDKLDKYELRVYRQEDQDVIVTKENDHYLVKFLNPQRAIASWQIVALFVNDELVASWVIA